MRKQNDWNGLMRVIEALKLSETGEVLWRQTNIKNMLHTTGEEYILKVLFRDEMIPENYYLGLDDRATVVAGDDMSTIENDASEPTTNGYTRQPVSSTTEFTVALSGGINVATGPVVVFQAVGGSWGPVQNLFLTTETDYSGYLVGTVTFNDPVTLSSGQSLSLRMGFSLRDST